MTINVSYMGTKRQIAPLVARIIAKAPKGPLLDAFCGISAIGDFIAPSRPLWCNDAQTFAATVAEAFFVSPEMPPSATSMGTLLRKSFDKNRLELESRFYRKLSQEKIAFESEDFLRLYQSQQLPTIQSSWRLKNERLALHQKPHEFPYRLFSITHAGGYFSLRQAINIDSLRYAIDSLLTNETISADCHRWLCLGLCQAVSKVATTTGHFAQFLKVKETSIRRFSSQRRRSVWDEFLIALRDFKPHQNLSWRKTNRVFCCDALTLLRQLSASKTPAPAIIYADPPYTSDQYSRYYHLYETLLRYDYPASQGEGRYRPDRFTSPFSLKAQVESSIDELISLAAQLKSKLVLSYPGQGLLPDSEHTIRKMLRRHYGRRGSIETLSHLHSSLGASKGAQQYEVQEMIFSVG